LPEDTVVVAMNQMPGATGFGAYPERYDELEALLVPEAVRSSKDYWAYYLSFNVADVGDLLAPLPALDPRPDSSLPRAKPS
jgi:hypothetical protein